jgi:hypothetical protein
MFCWRKTFPNTLTKYRQNNGNINGPMRGRQSSINSPAVLFLQRWVGWTISVSIVSTVFLILWSETALITPGDVNEFLLKQQYQKRQLEETQTIRVRQSPLGIGSSLARAKMTTTDHGGRIKHHNGGRTKHHNGGRIKHRNGAPSIRITEPIVQGKAAPSKSIEKAITGQHELDFDLSNDEEYIDALVRHYASSSTRVHLPLWRRGELNCQRFHNMSARANEHLVEAQKDMVYWQNIPEDNLIKSPFLPKPGEPALYLTFDIDLGGWNNRRLSFETMVAYAIAMGRILVLPPPTALHHPDINQNKNSLGKLQQDTFGFEHVFHSLEDIPQLAGVISMEQFLDQVAMQGKLKDSRGNAIFPPNNRTNWIVKEREELQPLMDWLQNSITQLQWDVNSCFGAFPKSKDPADAIALEQAWSTVSMTSWLEFLGHPVPVNGSIKDRIQEYRGDRDSICVYNNFFQNATFLHISERVRTLAPFYSMTFFQDWRYDLWLKRVMRDHLRYNDDIQCAAAHVVAHVRDLARNHDADNVHGIFDSMHVRYALEFRHSFGLKEFNVSEIYAETQKVFPKHSTVFIATDARDLHFFDFLRDHYNLVFLKDCQHILRDLGLNTNFLGLIDQLVASRGRFYFSSWFSTFGSYIARLQGYHMAQEKAPGVKEGSIATWPLVYRTPDEFWYMRQYFPVKQTLWAREFPTCWRNLDARMQT